jgi:hypothetical protein
MDKGRPARKTDELTAICEPIICKVWKPRRLTTLWDSTACYRDGFTFTYYCTVLTFRPGRSQQSAQWIWSSLLTGTKTVQCAMGALITVRPYQTASATTLFLPRSSWRVLTLNPGPRSNLCACTWPGFRGTDLTNGVEDWQLSLQ